MAYQNLVAIHHVSFLLYNYPIIVNKLAIVKQS